VDLCSDVSYTLFPTPTPTPSALLSWLLATLARTRAPRGTPLALGVSLPATAYAVALDRLYLLLLPPFTIAFPAPSVPTFYSLPAAWLDGFDYSSGQEEPLSACST